VFQDSLDGLSLDDEGGWTHYDNSGGPTAWHIDTFQACTGHSWWCGMIDSTWIYDNNRAGYDNSWTQILGNSVNLNGVAPGTIVTLEFDYKIKAEPGYDMGSVEVGDLVELFEGLGGFTGDLPGGGACGHYSAVIPESTWTGWNNHNGGMNTPFRFVFTSDIKYSSSDGLYQGDGWFIDNVRVKAGAVTKFFDDMESGMGSWTRTTLPPVGDYYAIANNVITEDLCNDNRTNVWVDWDPVVFSVVPRLDDRLITPPVFVNRSSQVLVAFDIYRNLPLDACFYYSINYRTRNAGDPTWGLWKDPTNLLYYGSSRDWIRQKITLPEAGGKDSVEVMFIVKDYGQIFCGGPTGFANIYPLFDNVAIGVKALAPPVFLQRDLDLFQDTFRTTAFFGNDNFNTPLGDSAVVQVSTSRGYKNGFMYYRFNNGSWNSVALQQSAPSLPTYRWADVPAGAYAAGTNLQYYFAVTDSADSVAFLPTKAPTTQTYFQAAILPVKTAINPALGCTDSIPQILFVNNNAGRETEATIAKALTAQGYKFDTWDVNGPTTGAGNTPGGSPSGDPFYFWPGATVNDLLRYSTIIWHAGSLSQYTIRQPDMALIQSWIQQAGKNRNLLLIGDNIAWELIVQGEDYNSFLDFTMGVRYLRNLWENVPQDSLHPVVTGYAGSPTAGRFMHANSDCPFIEDFDLIGTSIGAPSRGKSGNLLKYPNNLAAATRFATKYTAFGPDSARTALVAFNYNNIEETGERIRLIKDIMTGYFGVPACYYATAVEDPAAEAPPLPNKLYQNAPNPFNPATTIRYSLASAGWATIRVYGVGGALVRTLVDRHHAAGIYTVRWDGKDDGGRRLSSGVYFYRLETASGESDAKKLLMLK
jgi:flagellar hook capping protein FlgD